MKRLTIAIFSLIFLFILPLSVFAQTTTQGKAVVLPKNEIVNKDYFATGETVTLSGTVNGDAYVAGGTVFIDGPINGDLLVAGGTVHIRGPIKNDVRVAGGTITIDSPVGGNVTVGGGTVTITDSAIISGSLTGGAGTLSVFGPVGKGMTIGSGDATIGNTVGGEITAGVDQLTLTSQAKVQGDLNYWSSQKAQIANEASIAGEINYHLSENNTTPKEAPKAMGEAFAGLGFSFKLFEALAAFIVGALIIRFSPVYIKRVTDASLARPWRYLAIGFVTVVITPILIGLLFVTLLGIPLAILLLVLYILELYIAKIFTALLIGQKLFEMLKQNGNLYILLLVGIVVGIILEIIPVVGWLILLVVYFIAFGGLVDTKKDFYTELRNKKLI